jgi:hypothetical protein
MQEDDEAATWRAEKQTASDLAARWRFSDGH